jgi:hypothetical protein
MLPDLEEMRAFRFLLPTTTGCKTGRRQTTPLGYFDHVGGYAITASNAGVVILSSTD